METIGQQKLWTILKDGSASAQTCVAIRKAEATPIEDYMQLASKVAELQFLNRDFVLLYRGQGKDHRNKAGNSSLRPSLFRSKTDHKVPSQEVLARRFQTLSKAEALLVEHYSRTKRGSRGKVGGQTAFKRQQILRWSILQHYEVCRTPLIDVTHSLRIASSFASACSHDEAYLFVLGVPNISGAITASAESGLQIVRLSSVCPPEAMRPHVQEGYLLGEYPDLSRPDQKEHYTFFEIDFGRRLVAKFRFNPRSFWKDPLFPRIDEGALYPNTTDPLFELTQKIKSALSDSS